MNTPSTTRDYWKPEIWPESKREIKSNDIPEFLIKLYKFSRLGSQGGRGQSGHYAHENKTIVKKIPKILTFHYYFYGVGSNLRPW